MEAFSLLKYWKSIGTGAAAARVGALDGGGAAASPVTSSRNGNTTTIVAAGDFDSDAGDDEGPFFDLKFAVPEEDDDDEALKLERESGEIGEIVAEYDDDVDDDDDDDDDDGRERELKLRPLSSTSSYESEHCDSNVVSLPPSDEVLFKGQIARIEGDEEVNSKSGQIPIPASLLRSATKFQVFMLKLKRSKSDSITTTSATTKPEPQKQRNNKKFFAVKFKVEEAPVISLLGRASSNSNSNSKSTTTTASSSSIFITAADEHPVGSSSDSGDEKRNKKEVIQKYLKLVKPLYIRVSKRNQAPPPAAEGKEEVVVPAAEKSEMKGQKALVGLNLKGMMMAKKHLGKSKSAVVHSNSNMQNVVSNRRDDSLLQQQDGIQGAILHCKRSFNNASTRDLEEKEEAEAALVLTRSASDPSHEKKRTTETELTRVKEEKNDVVGSG